VNRTTSIPCAGSNGADGGEYVLDAVIELSEQCALVLMSTLALGDVNVNAHHPLWTSVTTIGNETALFDPSNFAARVDNSVFDTVFVPTLAEGAPSG